MYILRYVTYIVYDGKYDLCAKAKSESTVALRMTWSERSSDKFRLMRKKTVGRYLLSIAGLYMKSVKIVIICYIILVVAKRKQ